MHVALLLICIIAQARGAIMAAPAPAQPEQKEIFVAPFIPMPAPPALPKVDLNSCPFEGCQFGKWTAEQTVKMYSSWRPEREEMSQIAKGQEVTALTGVNVVIQPAKGVFTRDVPMFGAKAGDMLYSYQNCGEGAEDIWVHGRFIKCADPNFSWKAGLGCDRDCNGRYLDLGKSEWWAQIRLSDGTTGWVLVNGNFDGTDGLG
jgi:hypothetical protein